MKLKFAQIRDFKRFTDLQISGISEEARLVILVGPNGSGKTSLFEAFNFWSSQGRNSFNFTADYHVKGITPLVDSWRDVMTKITIEFYDVSGDARRETTIAKKLFYLRSAYRHEPDFTIDRFDRVSDILEDIRRPSTMMQTETRVSDNYQRIISLSVEALFDPSMKSVTAGTITDRLIGRVREAVKRVFPDLLLTGPGRPMEGGTFFFEKGVISNYHYKNLSGGEKAAFDLLLDFIIKSESFDNTIFCIDEPELHMHTKLQSNLINELYQLLPPNCQLWIATHSIGMIRRAMELYQASPNQVVFLDFGGRDFDKPQLIKPVMVNRTFWKQVFGVALDDLAELVAPSEIIFCEGTKEVTTGKRNPSFDATVYRTIFEATHPDTEFVPLGGVEQVEKDAILVAGILSRLFRSVKMWSVFDRDDRSSTEISDLKAKSINVLGRRDLESYLWDDEVITKLCTLNGAPQIAPQLIAEKRNLLAQAQAAGKPIDDIKQISGQLYNQTKKLLMLTGVGNNASAFARDTLAPLINSDMAIYAELEQDIFGA